MIARLMKHFIPYNKDFENHYNDYLSSNYFKRLDVYKDFMEQLSKFQNENPSQKCFILIDGFDKV